LEHHFPGLRDTEPNRAAYVARLVDVIEVFLEEHLGIDWNALPDPISLALPAARSGL